MDLPLHHLFQSARDTSGPTALLVLMHGIGSNAEDLFGMAGAVPAHFHVLSLQAPHQIAARGWAWFQIAQTATGRVIDDAQEAASLALVAQTVEQAARESGVPASRVVVGGFSQGGIMSLSLLLTRPACLGAAMVMHGRLLDKRRALALPASAWTGKSLWVSHGTADTMIPLSSAQAIRDTLADLPLALSYHEFPGGHEIRAAEFQQAMAWLGTLQA